MKRAAPRKNEQTGKSHGQSFLPVFESRKRKIPQAPLSVNPSPQWAELEIGFPPGGEYRQGIQTQYIDSHGIIKKREVGD